MEPLSGALVFISYVEEDHDVAVAIARGLEAAGYRTWYYERDSDPGPSYLEQVFESIRAAEAFLVLISKDSMESEQVDREVVLAHETEKKVIPLTVGIGHSEFQKRRPSWRVALGSAVSVSVDPNEVGAVVPRVIRGLHRLGVDPAKRDVTPPSPPQVVDTGIPVAPVEGGVRHPYASLRVLTSVLTGILIVTLFTSLARAYLDFNNVGQLSQALSEGRKTLDIQSPLMTTVNFTHVVAGLALGITQIVWLYRAHRNLPALGAKGLRFTPWKVVAGYLIPILNFFRPVQSVSEIWRASDPDATDSFSWRQVRVPAQIAWWWILVMVGGFLVPISGVFLAGKGQIVDQLNQTWTSLLSTALVFMGSVFALMIFNGISGRQEAKNKFVYASQWVPPTAREVAKMRAMTTVGVLGGLSILLLPALLFPVFAQAKLAAKKTASMSNMKQLSTGVLMYQADNDDQFPDMRTQPAFQEATMPYIKMVDLYYDLLDNRPFTPNANFAYASVTAIESPAEAIDLYGDLQKDSKGRIVGFADGHVKWLTQEQWDILFPKSNLDFQGAWDPSKASVPSNPPAAGDLTGLTSESSDPTALWQVQFLGESGESARLPSGTPDHEGPTVQDDGVTTEKWELTQGGESHQVIRVWWPESMREQMTGQGADSLNKMIDDFITGIGKGGAKLSGIVKDEPETIGSALAQGFHLDANRIAVKGKAWMRSGDIFILLTLNVDDPNPFFRTLSLNRP